MGHIKLNRTKYKKGNYKIFWDCANGSLATLGRYIPSKAYYFINLPYYHARKTTATEKKLNYYLYKNTLKNWLN